MEGLRNLPKIDELLADARIAEYTDALAARRITAVARDCVRRARENIIKEASNRTDRAELYEAVMGDILAELKIYYAERLMPVINATGVVIHTNLGRAVLSKSAVRRVVETAAGYSNLEYSTVTGKRSGRLRHIEGLLTDLTGAESALVVNNNAAAVLLSLNTLCRGREVLLSRGEIVEIGDSFRISEIISASGCKIREIGTTNRTYLSDYEQSINHETGAIAKIHTSNYKITGFAADTPAKELAALAARTGVPLIEDMGSGVFVDLRRFGLPAERTARDAVADGADVITISGDKMLGGPQAGIILGKAEYLSRLRKNQLLRCLRVDKLSLAALEATLMEYTKKTPDIPVLKCIGQAPAELRQRAERLMGKLNAYTDFTFAVEAHTAQIGGGAMPSQALQSYGVSVKSARFSPNKLEALLRGASTPVIGVLQDGRLLLDVLAIPDESFGELAAAFASL